MSRIDDLRQELVNPRWESFGCGLVAARAKELRAAQWLGTEQKAVPALLHRGLHHELPRHSC